MMTLSSLQQQQASPRSIFDVARLATSPHSLPAHTAALHRIFYITSGHASATVGPALGTKFGLDRENKQLVVSVSNRWTLEQVWWNETRTKKPQTFSSQIGTAGDWRQVDPTDGGRLCDFCQWQSMTACDPGFQRIENRHAVTASNLFKYAEPCHGLVLFKHHDPLDFSEEQLGDLLDASIGWFQQSAQTHAATGMGTSSSMGASDAELEPFLLWNCLPRAGASQFHGHAQVMLTSTPTPQQQRLRLAADAYAQHPHTQHATQQQHHDRQLQQPRVNSANAWHCYYADLLRAHEALGLLHACSTSGSGDVHTTKAGIAASTARTASTPTATDKAGTAASAAPMDTAWAFASLVAAKDMEVVVAGSHLGSPALRRMLHAAMRALIDRLGVRTFNVGVLNLRETLDLGKTHERTSMSHAEASGLGQHAPLIGSNYSATHATSSSCSGLGVPGRFARPPVLVRVVSRGKVGAPASDYGGLEVFGGASIGHTDPYIVAAALDQQLGSYT